MLEEGVRWVHSVRKSPCGLPNPGFQHSQLWMASAGFAANVRTELDVIADQDKRATREQLESQVLVMLPAELKCERNAARAVVELARSPSHKSAAVF